MEGLESEVDQLQNVLQSVANELESGHQHAQVTSQMPRQLIQIYTGGYWLLELMFPWQLDEQQLHLFSFVTSPSEPTLKQ